MLSLLGYGMIVVFMILIMTKKLSAQIGRASCRERV